MRYLFRGLRRDTAKSVWGYVEAELESHAYDALSEEGVVVESLEPAPRPQEPWDAAAGEGSEISGEIDHALDAGSKQVNFDDLSQRYRGKQVWVLDRDKMRRQVMGIVDTAIAQSQQRVGDQDTKERDEETRDHIAGALKDLFGDQRNITSEASAAGSASSPALENQVDRLERAVNRIERAIASIGSIPRGGGGGGYSRTFRRRKLDEEHDKVLMEIFQSNVELQRAVRGESGSAQEEPAQSAGT